jgi:hypothetical protein
VRIYFAGPLFTPYERGYIDDCAALLRADGFDVLVPHEHELALDDNVTAEAIFANDRVGIEEAHAMLALLDGPAVDDGTAGEIGMFHALMRSDPEKRGIVGLLTDIRGPRGESTGMNLFVQGVIEDAGEIVDSLDAAQEVLRRWRWARRPAPARRQVVSTALADEALPKPSRSWRGTESGDERGQDRNAQASSELDT